QGSQGTHVALEFLESHVPERRSAHAGKVAMDMGRTVGVSHRTQAVLDTSEQGLGLSRDLRLPGASELEAEAFDQSVGHVLSESDHSRGGIGFTRSRTAGSAR